MLKIRAGTGYDIHRLETGEGLFIGGIKVSDDLRFVAHSDGDVLLHALIDSLLGASGQPDIGDIYPDTDTRYQDIPSSRLLEDTINRLDTLGFRVVNIDCTIVAQRPSLKSHKSLIRANLSGLLHIPEDSIGVKAKTREGLDSVGRGEAIECYCICMIRAKD